MSAQEDLARLHKAAHRVRVATQALKDLTTEGWQISTDCWRAPTQDVQG